MGMQQLNCVSSFTFHAQQDVECSQSRWRNSHAQPPPLTQPLACGGTIAVDKLTCSQSFFSFRLELQQFQHGALSAADKELFVADAQFAGIQVGQCVFRTRAQELQVFAAKQCVGPGPRLKAAKAVMDDHGRTSKVDRKSTRLNSSHANIS